MNVNTFNPNYDGYRGVYFGQDNQIKYNLFAETNGVGWIGKLTGTLTFRGDTLYENLDTSVGIHIYVKLKLPKEYLNYTVMW